MHAECSYELRAAVYLALAALEYDDQPVPVYEDVPADASGIYLVMGPQSYRLGDDKDGGLGVYEVELHAVTTMADGGSHAVMAVLRSAALAVMALRGVEIASHRAIRAELTGGEYGRLDDAPDYFGGAHRYLFVLEDVA